MERLTAVRCNGIKNGYWSPAKKDELAQRLGAYEDTGLTPAEVKRMKEKNSIGGESAPHAPEQDNLSGSWQKRMMGAFLGDSRL